MLWFQTFKADLESIGFKFNPYDPCVANRKVKGSQHTVRFHVDDVMSSHLKPSVNRDFLKWLNKKYGNYGEVKATTGKIHDYLGMTFDFSVKGKVSVDMAPYINSMVDDFSIKFKPNETAPTPAADYLFSSDDDAPHDDYMTR